jgi:RNA polymerase sigma factor (sigma-70 family)
MRFDPLTRGFEAERARLRGVAYRITGSLAEAEDAVQEAWLRLRSSKAHDIGNLGGWLTTVVSRISLDLLRSRKARREEDLVPGQIERFSRVGLYSDPEQEALLAESVGIGLLIVLDRLSPAERLAFVLHDLFGIPFKEIAPIVGRSITAARQLASRARRQVRGASLNATQRAAEQHRLVSAFFAAARDGEFEKLLLLLDPNVVLSIDRELLPPGAPDLVKGAATVAKRALIGASRAQHADLMRAADGICIAVAPFGQLQLVMTFIVAGMRIQRIDIVADPRRLNDLQLAPL